MPLLAFYDHHGRFNSPVLGYSEDDMTQSRSNSLSQDMRVALTTLVERDLASAQDLRDLLTGDRRMLRVKADLKA